jgi:hypothetical protein
MNLKRQTSSPAPSPEEKGYSPLFGRGDTGVRSLLMKGKV